MLHPPPNVAQVLGDFEQTWANTCSRCTHLCGRAEQGVGVGRGAGIVSVHSALQPAKLLPTPGLYSGIVALRQADRGELGWWCCSEVGLCCGVSGILLCARTASSAARWPGAAAVPVDSPVPTGPGGVARPQQETCGT